MHLMIANLEKVSNIRHGINDISPDGILLIGKSITDTYFSIDMTIKRQYSDTMYSSGRSISDWSKKILSLSDKYDKFSIIVDHIDQSVVDLLTLCILDDSIEMYMVTEDDTGFIHIYNNDILNIDDSSIDVLMEVENNYRPGYIAKILNKAPGTVTHHLNKLRDQLLMSGNIISKKGKRFSILMRILRKINLLRESSSTTRQDTSGPCKQW